jgi:hypothetical protein
MKYVLIFSFILILISGCISSDVSEDVIYGKWAGDMSINESIEFFHDGSVRFNFAGDTIDGMYEFKDMHLRVDLFAAHTIHMDGTIRDIGLSYELILVEQGDVSNRYRERIRIIYLKPKYKEKDTKDKENT